MSSGLSAAARSVEEEALAAEDPFQFADTWLSRHIMFSGSAATDHWLLVTGYSRLCRHM